MFENISELIGKTFASVDNIGDEQIVFTAESGEKYRFYHAQNCCEIVSVEDVIGDLSDLVGSPLVMAEEVTNEEYPPAPEGRGDESYTWTFYKFATIKGYVTIRWYGTSNGYYSESVDFEKCEMTPLPPGRDERPPFSHQRNDPCCAFPDISTNQSSSATKS